MIFPHNSLKISSMKENSEILILTKISTIFLIDILSHRFNQNIRNNTYKYISNNIFFSESPAVAVISCPSIYIEMSFPNIS